MLSSLMPCQNRERFYERAVKKKVSPRRPKVLDRELLTQEAAQC